MADTFSYEDATTPNEPKRTTGAAQQLAGGFGYEEAGTPTPPATGKRSNVGRGFEVAMRQLPQTAGGAVALLGDATGATGLRDWGMGVYKGQADKIAAMAQPSDSFSNVLEGSGNVGDFLGYGAGYVGGQAAQALATGGLGGMVGKQLVRRGVAGAVGQTAEQVAAREARGALAGQGAALAGYNYMQEAGSIYPEAVDQAHKDGRELTGGDLARVAGAAGAAAAVETLTDTKMLKGVFQGASDAPTYLRRAASTVPRAAVREAGTEALQTEIERFGAQQSLTDKEAVRDVVDSAALGGVGGGLGGAASAVVREQPAPPAIDPNAGPVSRAAALLAAPVVTVDTEGRAKMDGVPSGGFEAQPGPDGLGQQAPGGPIDGTPPAAPTGTVQRAAALLPPPAIEVGPNGEATTPEQRNAQAQLDLEAEPTPGPRETGAIGQGRNSELVPRRQLPPPTIEVDGDGTATTGEQRNAQAQVDREADIERSADNERRRSMGLDPLEADGTITDRGSPFKTRIKAQQAAKRNGPDVELQQVDGGFVLRRRSADITDVEAKTPQPETGTGQAPTQPGSGTGAAPIQPETGTAPQPEDVERRAAIDLAAHGASTSPHNDLPEPTDAQKQAGNYAKGHLPPEHMHGLDVTIENARGSTRSGKRPDGSTWSSTMSDHYGYIRRTKGADDEQVDAYIGPTQSDQVHIVDQLDPQTGKFDEHKVMLDYPDRDTAIEAYRSNFDPGWKVGPVTSMSVPQFKEWLKNADLKQPAAGPAALQAAPDGAAAAPDAAQAAQPAGSDLPDAAGTPDSGAAPVTPENATRYGRGGKPLDEGGKPFKTRLGALQQQKGQPGTRVVKHGDGWVLRDQTDAELAAQKANGDKRQSAARAASWEKNPLLSWLAGHGLYHRKDDPRSLKSNFSPDANPMVPGAGPVFRGNGRFLDELTDEAIADGFLPEGADQSQMEDLVSRVMRGERVAPIYRQGGADEEAKRRQRFDEQPDDIGWDDIVDSDPSTIDLGLTDEDLEAADYASLSPEEQAQFRDLIALAQAKGIDTESLLEDAHYADPNGSPQDLYRAARAAIEQALAASDRGRGESTGQQGPSRGDDEEGPGGQVEPHPTAPPPAPAPSGAQADLQQGLADLADVFGKAPAPAPAPSEPIAPTPAPAPDGALTFDAIDALRKKYQAQYENERAAIDAAKTKAGRAETAKTNPNIWTSLKGAADLLKEGKVDEAREELGTMVGMGRESVGNWAQVPELEPMLVAHDLAMLKVAPGRVGERVSGRWDGDYSAYAMGTIEQVLSDGRVSVRWDERDGHQKRITKPVAVMQLADLERSIQPRKLSRTGGSPLHVTPMAQRERELEEAKGDADEAFDYQTDPPTEHEIRQAAAAVRPGMFLNTHYGTHAPLVVDTVTIWPANKDGDGVSVQIHAKHVTHPKSGGGFHRVFLRHGQLWEEHADTNHGEYDEARYWRIYVLDEPMGGNGQAPDPDEVDGDSGDTDLFGGEESGPETKATPPKKNAIAAGRAKKQGGQPDLLGDDQADEQDDADDDTPAPRENAIAAGKAKKQGDTLPGEEWKVRAAREAREQQEKLDRGEFVGDAFHLGIARWRDGDPSPIERWKVPAGDFPHVIVWNWANRNLDELRQRIADGEAEAAEAAKAAPAKKAKKATPKKGSDDISDPRRSLPAMKAALAWAEAGGAERYPVPQRLIDKDRIYPGAFWDYDGGEHGLLRRYLVKTDKGTVQVDIDAARMTYDGENGILQGIRAVDVSLHGESISETGYRSLAGSADFDNIKHDPEGFARFIVEKTQAEEAPKLAKAKASREKAAKPNAIAKGRDKKAGKLPGPAWPLNPESRDQAPGTPELTLTGEGVDRFNAMADQLGAEFGGVRAPAVGKSPGAKPAATGHWTISNGGDSRISIDAGERGITMIRALQGGKAGIENVNFTDLEAARAKLAEWEKADDAQLNADYEKALARAKTPEGKKEAYGKAVEFAERYLRAGWTPKALAEFNGAESGGAAIGMFGVKPGKIAVDPMGLGRADRGNWVWPLKDVIAAAQQRIEDALDAEADAADAADDQGEPRLNEHGYPLGKPTEVVGFDKPASRATIRLFRLPDGRWTSEGSYWLGTIAPGSGGGGLGGSHDSIAPTREEALAKPLAQLRARATSALNEKEGAIRKAAERMLAWLDTMEPKQDLLGAAPNASQQAANKLRAEREEQQKRQQQAAPDSSEFTMTGSTRQRDEGAARGQDDLFGGPAPAKKEETAFDRPERAAPAYMAAFDLAQRMGLKPPGPQTYNTWTGPVGASRTVTLSTNSVKGLPPFTVTLSPTDEATERGDPFQSVSHNFKIIEHVQAFIEALRSGDEQREQATGDQRSNEEIAADLERAKKLYDEVGTKLDKGKQKPGSLSKRDEARLREQLEALKQSIRQDDAQLEKRGYYGNLDEDEADAGNTVVNGLPRAEDVGPDESLLLMPCSDGKLAKGGRADTIYTGPYWQTFRQHKPEDAPQMLVLSAKHGFMLPEHKVEPYDEEMTPARAAELTKQAMAAAMSLRTKLMASGKPLRDVQIVGGAKYRPVMRALVAELQRQGAIARGASIRETTGRGNGDHRNQLATYLDGFKAQQKDPEGFYSDTPDFNDTFPRPLMEKAAKHAGTMFNGLTGQDLADEVRGVVEQTGFALQSTEGQMLSAIEHIAAGTYPDSKRPATPAQMQAMRDDIAHFIGTIDGTLDDFAQEFGPKATQQFRDEVLPNWEQRRQEALAIAKGDTAPVSATSSYPELAAALEQYENTGEIATVGDLVDEVDALIGGEKAPESLQHAVDAWRDEQAEDMREWGGRGDSDGYDNRFLEALRGAIGTKAEASSAPAPAPLADDDSPEAIRADVVRALRLDRTNHPTRQPSHWHGAGFLAAGRNIVIFADGAIRVDGVVQPFKLKDVWAEAGQPEPGRTSTPRPAPKANPKEELQRKREAASRTLQALADKARADGLEKLADRLTVLRLAPAEADKLVARYDKLAGRARENPADTFFDLEPAKPISAENKKMLRRKDEAAADRKARERFDAEHGNDAARVLRTKDGKAKLAAYKAEELANLNPRDKKLSAEAMRAKADLQAGLADLADLLHTKAGGKAFIVPLTPEQEQKLMPVLARIFDAAFRLGAVKFKQAARYVLQQIRDALGDEVADQITLDHLQGAYIAMGGKYRAQGADTPKAVTGVESKDEIEAEPLYVPGAPGSVEPDRGEPADQPGLGTDLPGEPGGNGAPAGGAAGPAGQGGLFGPEDGASLPAGGPAVVGVGGDQQLPGGRQPAGTEAGTPGGDLDTRSGGAGGGRVSAVGRPADRPVPRPDADADESAKAAAQRRAQDVPVRRGDLDNIREALPYLLPGQQEDVAKAEARFAKPDGFGMLFTNGTGTGKTFSGLGIVKRFEREGSTDQIIFVPDEKIGDDWIGSGKPLQLDITRLKDTKDAGEGIAITTMANLGQNAELARRKWKHIVVDEAHGLMQSADGDRTLYLERLQAIAMHPDGIGARTMMLHGELHAEREAAREAAKDAERAHNTASDDRDRPKLKEAWDKAEAKWDALERRWTAAVVAVREEVLGTKPEDRPRVTFLSATPFAYEKTVDWANGFLFDYEADYPYKDDRGGYNTPSPHGYFFIRHFGYRMRYGKLTEPDAKVDRGLMQRQFNTWLKKQGVLSSRQLDIKADYDRRFVLVSNQIGNRIDAALEWMSDRAYGSPDKPKVEGMSAVRDVVDEAFDYLTRRYLLEAIKAREVVPIVKKHLALGRKVVVFHDYNKGGGFNPFNFPEATVPAEKESNAPGYDENVRQIARAKAFNAARALFREEFKDLVEADFNKLRSPINEFRASFGDELILINGLEKKADVLAGYRRFQDDGAGPVVALVQADKNKGWSGHDTTGKHQRVLINLGLPTQPTRSIQQEGRIRRTGQHPDSNSIFRYLNTGTNWEKWAFATTIAQRASAAENLSMGEEARALKDAYIAAFEEADDYPPGHEGEGTGGKERDSAAQRALSEWDRAKAFYFGTEKKNAKTKAREGKDYFATPEPVGLKMVQWAGARGGEDVLEPSAGHGAIARWFGDTANRTAVEPSSTLRARLAMVFDGKIVDGTFEDLNVVNKFDAIVMNPPFGAAGKTAIEHLEKAATQHLREGGRIVALIPEGPATDKRLEKFLYGKDTKPAKPLFDLKGLKLYRGDTLRIKAFGREHVIKLGRIGVTGGLQYLVPEGGDLSTAVNAGVLNPSDITVEPGPRVDEYEPAKDLHLIADIHLPGVTFERASTDVRTHIIVLQKGAKDLPQKISRDYSDVDDINALFDRLEGLTLADRPEKAPEQAAQQQPPARTPAPAQAAAATLPPVDPSQLVEVTTQSGKVLRGVLRPDLTQAQAKAIDPYTWRPKGHDGWFIREKYLKGGNTAQEEAAVYQVNDPSSSYDIDLFPDTLATLETQSAKAVPKKRGLAARIEPEPLQPNVIAMREDLRLPGVYHVSTQLVTVGVKHLYTNRVTDWESASQALAGLSRYAVEHYDALVTDADGRVLAVVGSFKGAMTQTSVYPSTLVQEAIRIKGAAKVWGVHNHPSGAARLSRADINLATTLSLAFRPTDVEYMGIAAVAPQPNGSINWSAEDVDGVEQAGNFNPEGAPTFPVPVVEREVIHAGGKLQELHTPDAAKAIIRQISGGRSGVLLLNHTNAVVGWIPTNLQTLASGGGEAVSRWYGSLGEANVAAIILSTPGARGDESWERVANDIKQRLQMLDVRVLDALDVETNYSMAEHGVLEPDDVLQQYDAAALAAKIRREDEGRALEQEQMRPAPKKPAGKAPKADQNDLFNDQGTLFRQGGSTPEQRQAVADLQAHVDAITALWAVQPNVSVMPSVAHPGVPTEVRRAAAEALRNGGGIPRGVWFNGEVMLFADQLDLRSATETLYHEVLGHAGLRGHFGPELDRVLTQVANLRGADIAAMVKKTGMDPKDPQTRLRAAEEVLAYLAQTRPTLGIVQRAIAAIRNFLRDHVPGFASLTLTDNDIVQAFILPARGFIERGPGPGGGKAARSSDQTRFYSGDRTVQVDGKRRPIVNNLGQSITPASQGTQALMNFWRWMGDDPTLDENGHPRVFYTGTAADFSTFKARKTYFTEDPAYASGYAGSMDGVREGGNVMPVYIRAGKMLDLRALGGDNVHGSDLSDALVAGGVPQRDVDLLMESLEDTANANVPMWFWLHQAGVVETIRAAGFDSVLQVEENATGSTDAWVLFQPQGNVKSAIGNDGTFASSNADIRFSQSPTAIFGDLTPAQEQALRNVGGITQPKTLRQRFDELRANIGTRLRQGIVDQFAPIREVDQKAYMLARLSKGSEGTMEAALLYGKPFLRDGVPDVDVKDGGFAAVLAKLKGEHDRFLWWVAAQRAQRLKAEGRENLFTDRDISSLLTLADGKMADGTDRRAAFAEALKGLNEFNDAVLEVAQASGLIDQEARDLYRDQPYVPFYRVLEEDDLQGPRFSSGLVNQRAWQKLKGGTQKLNEDLLENMLLNWAHLYTASARNRAAMETMDAGDRLAVTYKVRPGTKDAVRVMRDGVAEHWAIEDPYLLDAVSSIYYTPSPLMKPLTKMKRVLTFSVTVNPAFKVRNLLRDSISALGQADLSYNPFKNVAQGWKASANNSQTYASMLASGGVMRFGSLENSERMRAKVEKLGGKLATETETHALKVAMENLWDAYNELGDRSENVNRAALYEQLVAKGVDHAQASYMARDLMDFSMSGAWPIVRFLTQTVPFLNARLQGLYKLGRAASEDPRRFATVAAAVSMASLALLMIYGDDDDWKKREDWDRDNYWWFKVGNTAFRIPKPFEIGAIGTMAERTAELMFSKEMDAGRFADRVAFMVSQTFSMNPIPQAISPLIEVYANRDSFTRRPIENFSDEKLPPAERYDERSSELARFLGRMGLPEPLSLVKGEYKALSPKQLDFLLHGYFSWVGASIANVSDYALRPVLERGERPDRKQGVGFVQPLPAGQSRYVTVFYEQAKDIEQAYAAYRQALREGDTEKAQAIAAEGKVLNHVQAGHVRNRMDALNTAARTIERNRLMSGEEKRRRLDQIEQQREELAKAYVTRQKP